MNRRIALFSALWLSVGFSGISATPASGAVFPQNPETQPTQLRISFGEDPTTMMRVVWQTKRETPKRTVEYGTSGELNQRVEGRRATYAQETGFICEATLTDLKPNTNYWYRVGSEQYGWSEVHRFRTARKDPKSFTFTAFGDQGVTKAAAQNVQNILAEKPLFHLLLGDLSYANGVQKVWDEYLVQNEPMTRTIPFMPTLGNHENERILVDGVRKPIGYASYLARFALPGVETWYSWDCGSARFIAFNSDDFKNEAQLAWLEKTLADARRTPAVQWIIVYQHHPLFGSSKGRDDSKALIAKVQPLFDKFRVDLVLAGHDHHYERQFPIRGGQMTSKDIKIYKQGEGTLYVKHGGGGKSLYQFSDPWPAQTAMRERTNGYLRITVRKDGPLTIEAKRLDRSLIEKVEIRR